MLAQLFLLNVFALMALFSNHRMIATVSFLLFTAMNIFLLPGALPMEAIFFIAEAIGVVLVFAWLSVQTREQTLTRQKKPADAFLAAWAILLAILFGHWLLGLSASGGFVSAAGPLRTNILFLVVAVLVWLVGREIYDDY